MGKEKQKTDAEEPKCRRCGNPGGRKVVLSRVNPDGRRVELWDSTLCLDCESESVEVIASFQFDNL